MRYLAQRYGTWEWLDIDLRLDTDGPEWTDTSYGVMTGTIAPDLGRAVAADGHRIVEPYGTLIHAETANDRRWTGIVTEVEAAGKNLRVTVREWAGYLDGLTFEGRIWGVKADPADLARQIWAHAQSYKGGDLGVSVVGSTPVRLGTDSSDKAIAAKAAAKAAKAVLDARAKARKLKEAEIQKASAPFATALKTLEASRKAQAAVVASLTKSTAGKTAAPLYWPFPTSTVTQWPSSSHNGTDFGIPQGTPVPATVDGVVVLTGADGQGAWCVHVRRSDGLIVQHGHLSRIDAKAGQRVTATNSVGLSGGQPGTPGAGNSTGPHLHWELRWDTVWTGPVVDPRSLSPATLGGAAVPGGAALNAAKKELEVRQNALNAKRAQRDAAIAPLRAQLDILKASEEAAKKPYDAAAEKARLAEEKERADGGAYRVLAADTPDCWRALQDLCDVSGMGFATRTVRTSGRPQLELQIVYPGGGAYRSGLVFQQGVNIVSELHPATTGEYASEVIVKGAGEGDKAIQQQVSKADWRMRRNVVIDDKRITTVAKAGAVGRDELESRTSDLQIDEITVVDHALAPFWSWQVGDVILVQGELPHLGKIAIKHRIKSWALKGDQAVIRLERSA